jgi:phage terminase large subunit-like protein
LGELTRAERNIAWVEKYIRVPEGKFVGQPLKLAPYMREDFRLIYDNPHGTRRAIISRGRKNAKTTESAIIALLHLCGPEAKPNSQLNSAAQSRDQAAILFSLAAKMVRLNPELNANVVVRDTAKQLACPELGTLYRALSADATTAYGLSPALTIHDELGR